MRLTLVLSDRWGRPVLAEIDLHRDTVEVWCHGVLVGAPDRDALRAWLTAPAGVYAVDDLVWIPAPTGRGVALAIDDVVPATWLPDAAVAALRESI
jgi:hypothetical protein